MSDRAVIIASADKVQRLAEDLKRRAMCDLEYGPDITTSLSRMLTSMACLMMHFQDSRAVDNIVHVDFAIGNDSGTEPPTGGSAA